MRPNAPAEAVLTAQEDCFMERFQLLPIHIEGKKAAYKGRKS